MSRTVRWGSPTEGHYEHQRSDSGVGSFSDCESRTSNTDRDRNFLASGYEDNTTIYQLQRALEQTRQQRDEFSKKIAELETTVRQLRNEIEQNKAHVRAVTDQNELFTHEKKTLAEKNKELSEQNTQLQEQLDDTIEKLKKSNRKSTVTSSPTAASSTTSESTEDKKPRRSASKRRPEKEKERDADREKEKREKERKREKREKEQHREHERPAEKEDDTIDRLRQRFDKHRVGDESDAKSGSIASSKTARASRPTSSYIEPLGLSTPRPQQTVPPSPARHHSYTAPGYPPSTTYASIREPSAYAQGAQRPAHPQVYIASGEYGYEEEEAAYHPHQVRTGRSERR
ncbi:uncharacterized protein PODANS_6_4800 [Podospora anserina S mat+]|uniref:Podospora anserina S mat+ genomic DNA chromosome 6, supercontig 2 n=2 Tax=Podospora TaxID=5144 RepID=B2B1X9_PODAN|nr:uncharacterized protein PODANS_6_4800 [Podospora anserina S mat+]KAK4640189.1 hypothetical protein QC761_604800 [Podospora bellae-mahoneyi]CAP71114.1 unnamed protein product [Podospora anserina S mat+]CDP30512.1 Putative protein of unknown function [Podospora anserina S mat+]